MTVPIPPVSGPVSPEQRYAAEDQGVPPDILAPLPDLAAMTAEAVSAGNTWCASAADWAESPQGDGLQGYTLAGDHPSGADGDWPDSMAFPHQGP
jgi:hypothetical protein